MLASHNIVEYADRIIYSRKNLFNDRFQSKRFDERIIPRGKLKKAIKHWKKSDATDLKCLKSARRVI